MATNNMKQCPYCAEFIQNNAVKCRYCGSMINKSKHTAADRQHWARVAEGRKIAGVCTGIAAELNAPQLILPLRIFFMIFSFQEEKLPQSQLVVVIEHSCSH